MGLIKVDQRRTSQPQTQVLPAQRWLDRGLAIAISGNNSWGKYAGGRLQPLMDTGIVSAGDAGIGRRYASSGYGSYDAAWMKPRSSGSTGPTTIVCCYSMQSVVGTQRVMSLGYDGAGGGGMMISPNATQQRVIINASGVNTVSNVGGALVAGETYITAGTISGTSLNAYHSDGAVTSGTGSVAWGATDFLRLATDDILSSYANVTVFGGYVFETALTKSDIDELMGNFHAVWKPRRIWVPVSAGGGGTYNVTLAESTAAADALGAVGSVVDFVAEAAAASELASTVGTVAAAVSESAAAAETLAAVAAVAAALTDPATVADLVAATMVAQAAVAEALAAADVVSAGPQVSGAMAEAATAADALTVTASLVAQVAEAASAADAAATAQQLLALITEASTVADQVSGAAPAAYSVTLAEVAAALDVITAALTGTTVWPLLAARGVSAHGHGSARPEQLSTATRSNTQ